MDESNKRKMEALLKKRHGLWSTTPKKEDNWVNIDLLS